MEDQGDSQNKKKTIIIVVVIVAILIFIGIMLLIWYYYYNKSKPTGSYSNKPPANNTPPDDNGGTTTTTTTGPVPASPSCPYYSGMPGKDIKDFDMDNGYFENQTLGGCQKLCDDNKCQWLTYDTDSFKCWLKQGINNNDVTTGLKIQSAIEPGCPTYTFLDKTDISGSDTFSSPYSVPTLDECRNLCDTNDCDWFTFNESESKCWLKTASDNDNKYTSFRTNQ